MKKLALLLILASSAFAKFPDESDARIKFKHVKGLPTAKNLIALNAAKNFEGFDYDLTKGKIEAAMYNMKIDKVEELKQETLELLMRVSTVEKLNMDRSEPIAVEGLINEIKLIESQLENIDIDTINFEGLDLIKEQIENKTFDLEELLVEL
ncbi:hypothetical protein [Bacteriovorax sp. Seq25_V]|uniref:hypothetical protein n=1 Tax=Bacteriovorax sp. Seq25_V TaxID=1201288 RepID=UPI00038A4200|nr:hypothetical protein [Bacteriovorax sp. Seq25_V]EQC47687.1 hypothetical protein M900_A0204 [Bacteriovorax sp. Seq25_V]